MKGLIYIIKPLYCCDDYMVDSDGCIISKRFNRPLKTSISPKGYLFTTIMINKKQTTIFIHHAVARTFLGDKGKCKLVINHKDGNKQNNSLDNLEWITPKENAQHSLNVLKKNIGGNHVRAKAVCGYDKKTGRLKYSFDSLSGGARELAKAEHQRFESVKLGIWRAINGDRKSYRGCIWKYVE